MARAAHASRASADLAAASPRRSGFIALALLLGLAALAWIYWDAIRTPFLNDDYVFLEQARTVALGRSLVDLGALGNYYRPLSRQIYFALLTPIAGGHPLVFHLVNAALFLGSLALVWDLLRAFLPRAGAFAGTLYFALLPLQRVNLMWVSCSQDLLALTGTLGAFALWRRQRMAPALLCFGAALASKEAALPFPLVLIAWDRLQAGPPWPRVLRRAAPFAALALVWVAISMAMRARHPAAAPLDFSPVAFLAGYVHMVQSMLGLDHLDGLGASLAAHGPALVPLLLLGAATLLVSPAIGTGDPAGRNIALGFGAVWMVAFGFVTGPVSYAWSSYYYTLAAVGAALVIGTLFSRGDRWTWLALVAGLAWWHEGATRVPGFAVRDDRWSANSHLTPHYFRRAAALTDSLSRDLVRVVPAPEPRTRFFFLTLPPWAGFQMGNGALIRSLYRDSTLASHFYSQFSETTAANFPVRILWWDGRQLAPLYEHARDPWFQVGSDLLLLERPAGARHAFARGLSAGGNTRDLEYWLGWAELFRGDRDAAEAAWTRFGARDDSLVWRAHLRAAHNAVTDGDTLGARRHLITAITVGIGRPEAHAVLGELLLRDRRPASAKYGLLELQVASWLNPRDWYARRALALGLAEVRLDAAAERALDALWNDFPALHADSAVAGAWRTYVAQGRGAAISNAHGERR